MINPPGNLEEAPANSDAWMRRLAVSPVPDVAHHTSDDGDEQPEHNPEAGPEPQEDGAPCCSGANRFRLRPHPARHDAGCDSGREPEHQQDRSPIHTAIPGAVSSTATGAIGWAGGPS